MTSQNLFEEIDRKMKDILARGPAADLEKNLRALLASACASREKMGRKIGLRHPYGASGARRPNLVRAPCGGHCGGAKP